MLRQSVGRRTSAAEARAEGQDGHGGERTRGAGASFIGLLASKRLAKKISTRIFERKRGLLQQQQQLSKKEPSYRMGPCRRFSPARVLSLVRSVMETRLEGFEYHPAVGSRLSEEIREGVKALGFDRYKIVVYTVTGQKRDQGIQITSRCTWDASLDNSASYTLEGAGWFCTSTVYGIYNE